MNLMDDGELSAITIKGIYKLPGVLFKFDGVKINLSNMPKTSCSIQIGLHRLKQITLF